MKVETRFEILWTGRFHMSLPCAYNFGLLSGSLLCFIVWNSIRKKTLNPTNVLQKSSFSVGKRKHIRCEFVR